MLLQGIAGTIGVGAGADAGDVMGMDENRVDETIAVVNGLGDLSTPQYPNKPNTPYTPNAPNSPPQSLHRVDAHLKEDRKKSTSITSGIESNRDLTNNNPNKLYKSTNSNNPNRPSSKGEL